MFTRLIQLVLLIQAASAFAVQGSSDEVLRDYAPILKSIVRIEREEGQFCTAVFVDSNILLTAKHCLMRDSNAREFDIVMHAGSQINVAGFSSTVVDLIYPPGSIFGNQNDPDFQDFALLLVKNNRGSDIVFNQFPPLPIARPNEFSAEFSTDKVQVLISGYGVREWQKGPHFGFGAGLTDVYLNPKAFVDDFQKQWIFEPPPNRYDQKRLKNFGIETLTSKGSVIEGTDLLDIWPDVFERTQSAPITLAGDSGTPALAVLSNNEVKIIGVLSGVDAGWIDHHTISLEQDERSLEFVSNESSTWIKADELPRKARAEGMIKNKSFKRDTNFSIKIKSRTINIWSSLLDEENSLFLQNALQDLRAVRDQK